MIINSTECRSPVVHRVEEPVLQYEISGVPDSPHVVGGSDISPLLITNMSRGCETTRDFAPHDQGESHDRIDEAAQDADHCEAGSTLKPRAIGATPPAAVCRPTQGLVDKVEFEICAAAFPGVADQARQVDLGSRSDHLWHL